MRGIEKAFGFYPRPVQVDAGDVRIRPLAEFDEIVERVRSCELVHDGWIYAGLQRRRDFMSGRQRDLPFSARVFGLEKTHWFEHGSAGCEEQVAFHLWTLSFFLGMRLTSTEAGYLDATTIEPGRLVDFVLPGNCLEAAIELAEAFWLANWSEPRNAQRISAAVHALFLGQYPHALQFEEFVYLYTALDACYKLAESLRRPARKLSHAERIEWMCNEFGIQTPAWAQATGGGGGRTEVSVLRNDALHEALYVGEPLGFALHGTATGENVTLEMAALVCRLLVALIGGQDSSYLTSPVDTHQPHGLDLR